MTHTCNPNIRVLLTFRKDAISDVALQAQSEREAAEGRRQRCRNEHW